MANKKVSIDDLNLFLQKHLGKQVCIKLYRELAGERDNVEGFILKHSEQFVLLQSAGEFRMDGYKIIRKSDIIKYRFNKFDSTQTKIYRAEGLLEKFYGIDFDIYLQDWQSIFRAIAKRNIILIIECEEDENPDFLIGPIKRVGKNTVAIQYFDATGLLDDYYLSIKYSDITTLTFGDNYSTVFGKYLKSKKTNESRLMTIPRGG